MSKSRLIPKHIVLALDTYLKPVDFVRKKSVWNRHVSGIVEVIDLQISKSGDQVTINSGVLDPIVYKVIWDEEAPKFIDEPVSTVRARIGELLDKREKWWQTDSDFTSHEIVVCVAEVVLPFLQRMRNRKEMISWLDGEVSRRLQPQETLALSVLEHLIGRNAVGCRILEDNRIKLIGAWRNRYEEVAIRLGCNLLRH